MNISIFVTEANKNISSFFFVMLRKPNIYPNWVRSAKTKQLPQHR
jgi:hypothetical protein